MMRTVVVVLAAILFSVTGCWDPKDLTSAEKEVARFHKTFNAGQFESLYDDSADEMKKAASKQDFVAFLDTIKRKAGKFESAKRTAWEVKYSTKFTNVVVDYEATFEQGKAMEEFVYRIVDGKISLAGYHAGTKNLPPRE